MYTTPYCTALLTAVLSAPSDIIFYTPTSLGVKKETASKRLTSCDTNIRSWFSQEGPQENATTEVSSLTGGIVIILPKSRDQRESTSFYRIPGSKRIVIKRPLQRCETHVNTASTHNSHNGHLIIPLQRARFARKSYTVINTVLRLCCCRCSCCEIHTRFVRRGYTV